MPTKRFRIAFSFAGEKRDFVKETAGILADRFGKGAILYDKYHEAEFAVYDLGIRLPKLYGEQSELIVPVLCPAYDTKRWTGWEWVHIYGLLTKADGHRVMPSRFEHAPADGLSPTAGFIELDDKTPEQFATLILERLALNEGQPKDHYLPLRPSTLDLRPSTPIPHNLPTLQPFFGREDELRKIADALDPDSRTWGALIDGPGGMGKTSLAVRAAYDASPEVFKKIIFITLKTREMDDDGVRDLSGFILSGLVELLNELARELGCDDIAKAPEDQRPRLLLDALRGTQTLLVLDNLESLLKRERDTLFTFVKKLPAGCKAILTSRGRIGSGAEELILEALSEEAALATLAELATHNPILARTNKTERLVLYRETSGKPLLLRWTAGQLGRGHCLTFTDALHFIRSCPEGNDPLEFIFGDLVADLSVAECKILCALTYFTLPTKVEHIAPLAEFPEQDTEHALRSLVNRSLVVPSDELQTFVLVPMVADFLRKKKSSVIAETGDRLELRAFALITKNGGEEYSRFGELDRAWATIAACLPRFARGPNDKLQEVCHKLTHYFDISGRHDEKLVLAREAEQKAIEAKDARNAGWRAFEIGWVYCERGDGESAIQCSDRARSHWLAAGNDPVLMAVAIYLRALGHRKRGDHSVAIVLLRDAIATWELGGPSLFLIAAALNALGETQSRKGQLDAAEINIRKSLKIGAGKGDRLHTAICTMNLAAVSLRRQNWREAEAVGRQVLEMVNDLRAQSLIAEAGGILAVALHRQDKTPEALIHAQRSVEIYTRLGSPDLADAQATLAECEQALAK